ncbi:hypothetical protein MNEG_14415 [Monoraphidium neglectum]|uniref:NPHP4 Ig-like domain-containing protein n=1 Tax=Monoraphidium neglectum TaxID=145388 RepID=A0A0D2LV99_9CHLO|nr:hypothetical protein MNEG_14415 [Monoraphidium neglectum]KIY93546.1 hypothetical protein MNEG_14415 [Monoraphidium neglectum]|eukprot:XP_013892566.1 hypothetical protein MNEG_14415 [Monoraphidium neglectum]
MKAKRSPWSQLQRGLVTSLVARLSPGETLLVLCRLANPLGRDAAFSVSITHPEEVQPVETSEELAALEAATGRGRERSGACGGVDGEEGGGGGGAAAARKLLVGDRLLLGAGEAVLVPFKLRLQPTGDPGSDCGGSGDGSGALQRRHVVGVAFTAAGHGFPSAVVEVTVAPRGPAASRSLRFHCAEGELMRAAVPLRTPEPPDGAGGEGAQAAGGGAGGIWAACSDPRVAVSVVPAPSGDAAGAGGGGDGRGTAAQGPSAVVHLKRKCGTAPEVSRFYVWIYRDSLGAQPLEVWQVTVHALRRIDVATSYGLEAAATTAVRLPPPPPAAASGRSEPAPEGGARHAAGTCRPEAFSSRPSEVRVAARPQLDSEPTAFAEGGGGDGSDSGRPAVAGAGGGRLELGVCFRPAAPGRQRVLVSVVDPTGPRQLLAALLVVAEARTPPVTRTIQVDLSRLTAAGRQWEQSVALSNPYGEPRTFLLSSSAPGLVSFAPATRLPLPARASAAVTLVVDARAGAELAGLSLQTGGASSSERTRACITGSKGGVLLVVVVDEERETAEECWRLVFA